MDDAARLKREFERGEAFLQDVADEQAPLMEDAPPKRTIDLALRHTFEQGRDAAIDHLNEAAFRRGGPATTTLDSSWLQRFCSICGHTFRLGDPVYVDLQKGTFHNSEALPCFQGKVIPQEAYRDSQAYFQGIDQTWPPPKDMPLIRLEAGHPLLTPPRPHFPRRHQCVVCGHTLRLYDQVVICPCNPLNPICRAAIHQDQNHGLPCYFIWNPRVNEYDKQTYCPITSNPLG